MGNSQGKVVAILVGVENLSFLKKQWGINVFLHMIRGGRSYICHINSHFGERENGSHSSR